MTAELHPLKPCPCCGGAAAMHTTADGWAWVECSRCHLGTQQYRSVMDDCRPLVAEAWNKRQHEPAQEELPL
ncbi:Lar family restriction alleviation protein [Acidovorax sp. NPDC077693]|uniref:Lar family restriction alleviation protein n=1 Tax=unclassified Acidovorax TaxID=2684926 RepID=UPI0037C8EDDA